MCDAPDVLLVAVVLYCLVEFCDIRGLKSLQFDSVTVSAGCDVFVGSRLLVAFGQRAAMRAIPGFTKEKFLNIVWSTLLMSVRSAHDSRGFSLMNSLSKLLQSLGDDCEGGRGKHLNTQLLFLHHVPRCTNRDPAFCVLTKVGLNGGATCRCCKAFQSVLLKKLCCLMFPFTPRRSSGSLTNSCKHTRGYKLCVTV